MIYSYTMEELCEDCIYAILHKRSNAFCNCKFGHEKDVNKNGVCPYRVRLCETCGEKFKTLELFEFECLTCKIMQG